MLFRSRETKVPHEQHFSAAFSISVPAGSQNIHHTYRGGQFCGFLLSAPLPFPPMSSTDTIAQAYIPPPQIYRSHQIHFLIETVPGKPKSCFISVQVPSSTETASACRLHGSVPSDIMFSYSQSSRCSVIVHKHSLNVTTYIHLKLSAHCLWLF